MRFYCVIFIESEAGNETDADGAVDVGEKPVTL